MKTKKIFLLIAVSLGIFLVSLRIRAGSLEPTSPPAPTMHTLNDIYNLSNAPGHPASFLSGFGRGTTDIYMDVEGIEGEVTDPGHEGWIDIVWVSYQVHQPTLTNPPSDGPGSSTPVITGFSIVKTIDRATPLLHLACCNGTNIPTVAIELWRAGGERIKYMKYTLSNVKIGIVAPLNISPSTQLEIVTFYFREIEWEYSHEVGGPVVAGWDLVTNEPN